MGLNITTPREVNPLFLSKAWSEGTIIYTTHDLGWNGTSYNVGLIVSSEESDFFKQAVKSSLESAVKSVYAPHLETIKKSLAESEVSDIPTFISGLEEVTILEANTGICYRQYLYAAIDKSQTIMALKVPVSLQYIPWDSPKEFAEALEKILPAIITFAGISFN